MSKQPVPTPSKRPSVWGILLILLIGMIVANQLGCPFLSKEESIQWMDRKGNPVPEE